MLLDAGGDPQVQDDQGENALSLARRHHNGAAVAILLNAGATPPEPRLPSASLPWPELTWEPEHLGSLGSAIPDDASPAAVVLSYIRAIYAWETGAWSALQASDDNGGAYDSGPSLELAGTVRSVHCTAKQRYPRASIGPVPELSPEFTLVEEDEATVSRRELLVRHPEPNEFVHQYEWIFICLRKGGRWRIDSAKRRLIGTETWRQAIL